MSLLTEQEKKALFKFKKQVLEALGDQILSFTLFGSRARGEGDEDSDVDVLVLLKERTASSRRQILDIASDLFLEYEIAISPLVMSLNQFENLKNRERLLAIDIEREGELL